MPTQAALTLTCCDQPFTTVSLMPARYIPDIRLETAEDTCMTLDSYRWRMLVSGQILLKAELVEGVVVLCGR